MTTDTQHGPGRTCRWAGLLRAGIMAVASMMAIQGPVAAQSLPTGDRLILVSGATGTQGGAVARELLQRGYSVRGLTRNPGSDRALALQELGVEMVQGDFDDPDSLVRALDGAWGAFSVQNFWEHGAEGEIRQGKNFADAALAAGVSHFVYSSVAHANEQTGIAHFDSKFEIEEHIRAIGIPHTIFRPVAFMENWEWARESIMGGVLAGPFDRSTVRQQISVRDIGRFVANAFDAPGEWRGIAMDIAGDENAVEELLSVFSSVTGRPVRYQQVDWTSHLEKEGEDMADMDRWIDEVGYHVDLEQMRSILPGMLTLEQYLIESGWEGNP